MDGSCHPSIHPDLAKAGWAVTLAHNCSRLTESHKVHSHLRETCLDPGDLWAARANQAVDVSANPAAREWLPGEEEPWTRCHSHYTWQLTPFAPFLQLHVTSSRLYTGGHGRTNYPESSRPLPLPVDAHRWSPPSLTEPCRAAPAAHAQRSLLHCWASSTRRRPCSPSREVSPPRGPPEAPGHLLAALQMTWPWREELRLRWRAYVTQDIAIEVYPVLEALNG